MLFNLYTHNIPMANNRQKHELHSKIKYPSMKQKVYNSTDKETTNMLFLHVHLCCYFH